MAMSSQNQPIVGCDNIFAHRHTGGKVPASRNDMMAGTVRTQHAGGSEPAGIGGQLESSHDTDENGSNDRTGSGAHIV